LNDCGSITVDIHSYRGRLEKPEWTDTEPGGKNSNQFQNYSRSFMIPEMFATLCTVEADTSQMAKAMQPRRGLGGALFYEQIFSVVLLFGLTELKAQLSWMEDVSTCLSLCCSPAYLFLL
jgi:hypothetical protein